MLKCSSLILKVASRCNLNCSYCYMYNLGDNTYKNQPKVMSQEVVAALINRAKNHCIERDMKEFFFVFHGGEPLLCGVDFFKSFIEQAEDIFFPEVVPVFAMQTNATLINDEWCSFFMEHNVLVSFSLDGYKEINDRNRVYHNGKGSFEDILKGLGIVKQYPSLKARLAVLSVLSLDADPLKMLQFYVDNEILRFDLLLPDSNYGHFPQGKESFTHTPYGDWLCRMFDAWYGNYTFVGIRLFINIINNLLGGNMSTDAYGAGLNELLVIETDGSIEAVDVLKICGEGFTKEGYTVLENEFEDAFNANLINKFIHANERPPHKCRSCTLRSLCGSGYLPHRFRNGSFDNPSIYCHDLARLITHIQNRVFADMPEDLIDEAGLSAFTYEEFLEEFNTNNYESEAVLQH